MNPILFYQDNIAENIDDFLPQQTSTIFFIFDEPFTEEEVSFALTQCSNNKAVGLDGLHIECSKVMLDPKSNKKTKLNTNNYVQLITQMFNQILDTGVIPTVWKNVIITIVPKPGDSRDCNNSRGISLIAHLGKVIEICLQQRVQKIYDKIVNGINNTQFGSMKGRGIDDALLISTILTSSALERNVNLYKCYIDLKKAYDRVSRKILFKILEKRGIPPKLLRLIKALHEDTTAQIRVDGVLSEEIKLNMGVKQGGVLSGLFWGIYMAAIIEEVHKRFE